MPAHSKTSRYHLTGWEPQENAFARHASEGKSYLESYCALAAELQINIVPGTIVEAHPSSSCSTSCPLCPTTPSASPRLLNMAYFISSTGSILDCYQKANLWHGERSHLSSLVSKSPPHRVIPTSLGPVGLLICWDLAVPEAFRALVSDGAKVIIVPAFWTGLGSAPAGLKRNPGFEKLMLQSLITTRAFENTAAVVFVNVGGPMAGNLGLSQVAMPFSGSVQPPMGGGEGMQVIELDLDELEEAEEYYKIREAMVGERWRYGNL